MTTGSGDTAGRLVGGAAQLIMRGGYNGFSYADLAEQFGIRKASIHHHFPSKVDLVVAVVEQGRTLIQAQIAALEAEPAAMDQLLGYTGYWARCITDQTAPFCLGAALGADMPSLPPEVAASVRGHFADLTRWLEAVLVLGVAQGRIKLDASPAIEAQTFLSGVYGAMLVARVFDDPSRFAIVVERFVDRIRV